MTTTPHGAARGAVTLRDVAQEASLSVSAVSMALRDSPRIGAKTKTRVRELAPSWARFRTRPGGHFVLRSPMRLR